MVFARRFPHLYHVTRSSALDGIRRHGLRPASCFTDAPENRDAWTLAGRPGEPPAWLRWQRMADDTLRRRLPASITPAQWRAHVNSMAFLFPTAEKAAGLAGVGKDAAVDQVVLRWETQAVLAVPGRELLVCRWNNGYPDRCRPPRIRRFEDYQPAAAWTGGPIAEVAVKGGLPPGLPFDVLAA